MRVCRVRAAGEVCCVCDAEAYERGREAFLLEILRTVGYALSAFHRAHGLVVLSEREGMEGESFSIEPITCELRVSFSGKPK
jgi:hypothetical protein